MMCRVTVGHHPCIVRIQHRQVDEMEEQFLVPFGGPPDTLSATQHAVRLVYQTQVFNIINDNVRLPNGLVCLVVFFAGVTGSVLVDC